MRARTIYLGGSILAALGISVPSARAFLSFATPLRAVLLDDVREKPESQAGAVLAIQYLSGSVLRKNGKDVNVPRPCKPTSCRHFETAEPVAGVTQVPPVAGNRWEMGKDQMVEGGFGPLKAIMPKEPTGRKVFEFGDHPAEFKVIAIAFSETGDRKKVKFQAFYRACLKKPFSKKWWTCTAYGIPGPLYDTKFQNDKFPVDVLTKSAPFTRPASVLNAQQALLMASGLVQQTAGSGGGGSGSGGSGGTQPLTDPIIMAGGGAGAMPGTVPAGQINKAIALAALSYQGASSAAGPDGGNQACAYMVNKVLQKALGHTIGANTNYVPSVEEALQSGYGVKIPISQAKPGDIIISQGQAHIGICMAKGCANVLSNSSSQASFSWQSDPYFGGAYAHWGGHPVVYRVVK